MLKERGGMGPPLWTSDAGSLVGVGRRMKEPGVRSSSQEVWGDCGSNGPCCGSRWSTCDERGGRRLWGWIGAGDRKGKGEACVEDHGYDGGRSSLTLFYAYHGEEEPSE